jgi:seryl-tRNA synthetase
MGIRTKIEEKIKKKEEEIQELENKIREAKAYLQALQDTIKILPKENVSGAMVENMLKPGSNIDKTYNFLKKTGKPVHLNEILIGIGKTISKKDKISLSGSLGWYVRRNEVFTRPAPNTFGLINFEDIIEPPDGFGIEKEEIEEN